jgi:hypothetical protein
LPSNIKPFVKPDVGFPPGRLSDPRQNDSWKPSIGMEADWLGGKLKLEASRNTLPITTEEYGPPFSVGEKKGGGEKLYFPGN